MALQVKRAVMLFFGIWVTGQAIMWLLWVHYHVTITSDLAIESCGVFALVAALVATIQLMADNTKKRR